MRNIVTDAYEKTCGLIRDNLDTIHRMASALLEKETLTGADIDEIMAEDQEPDVKKKAKAKKASVPPKKVKPSTESNIEEADVESSEDGKE